MSTYDVVIVGARCAGSPLAALLARGGLNVCVVDKAEFPSETPSTHAIQANGVHVLKRLGIFDELAELTEPIVHGRFAFGAARATTTNVDAWVGAPVLSLRRAVLDQVLVNAATEAGATVLTGRAVTGLLRDAHDRVVGVATKEGDISARLVVGADGTKSTVARLAGARDYLVTEFDRSFVWGYFEGVTPPPSTIWIGKIGDGAWLSTPTDSNLQMTAVSVDRSRLAEVSRDLDASFSSLLAGWPELAAIHESAVRIGDLRIMARGHGYFRQSSGPGWVLVGDAGHFKDPTPGQGIADALRQVEQLAPAIQNSLNGGGDAALQSWVRWRDKDAMEMYWLAHTMGAAGSLPLLAERMISKLSETEVGLEKFIRMMDHELAPSKVLSPGLLLRCLASGLLKEPPDRRQLLRDARAMIGDTIREQLASRKALDSKN